MFNKELFDSELRGAIFELNETDNCLENLANLIRILSMGVPECGDLEMVASTMVLIAEGLENIRDQLGEAIGLVIHLPAESA